MAPCNKEAKEEVVQVLSNLGVERRNSYDLVLRIIKRLQDEALDYSEYYTEPYKFLLQIEFEIVQFHDEQQPATRPAAKSVVEALERVDVTQNCAVCLDGLVKEDNEKELLVRMPCKHLLHQGCVVEWLTTSNVCPLCRSELPMEETK